MMWNVLTSKICGYDFSIDEWSNVTDFFVWLPNSNRLKSFKLELLEYL